MTNNVKITTMTALSDRKITRKRRFLAEMDRYIPLSWLESVIDPHWDSVNTSLKDQDVQSLLRI